MSVPPDSRATDKAALHAELVEALEREHASAVAAQKITSQGVTHQDARQEGDKDMAVQQKQQLNQNRICATRISVQQFAGEAQLPSRKGHDPSNRKKRPRVVWAPGKHGFERLWASWAFSWAIFSGPLRVM